MKLHYKIVSIILVMAIFSFNLVLLPVQAEEGCACDHPHGEDGFACFCGKSSLKSTCDSKGPSLSKKQCGLDKHDNSFCIPAHEHPTLLSTTDMGLNPNISMLQLADINAVSGTVLLPIEQPPSIL